MPQMSPMWWEILFMFFILWMFILSAIIYHNKNIKSVKKNEEFKNNQLNWKW